MRAERAIGGLRKQAERTDLGRKQRLMPALRGSLGVALLGALLGVGAQTAQAQTLTTLYNFTGGADGGVPFDAPILDANGVLYGTASQGGAKNPHCVGVGCGVVFKLTPDGVETVLYNFAGRKRGDGSHPNASLIRDAQGNLYGTTYNKKGTVFELNSSGTETVLHSFTGKPDGSTPSQLVRDAQGNLYGTTFQGGTGQHGTVFKVTSSGQETVLYRFTGKKDGGTPFGGVILDAQGNLYGTTAGGGAHKLGTVFMLSPNGTETVLYSFAGGADGHTPEGTLLRDAQGNLYGTTLSGGAFGFGTVFKVTASGTESVLHDFSGPGDGFYPVAGLIMDAQGNLYGATFGASCIDPGCLGSVFKMTPAGVETVLHIFTGGSDGFYPSGVAMDSTGTLYGTTYGGGASVFGTVFKLTP